MAAMHVLAHQLGVAARKIFGYGNTGRVAINSGATGENQCEAHGALHGIQQLHHAAQIVLKVFEWLCYTLAHGLAASKVNDGSNLMAMNQVLHQRHIGHTALLALNYLASDTL